MKFERERIDNRPILITGGCGFIGCNLADALARDDVPVLVLDNLVRDGARENARWLTQRHGIIEIRKGDVRNWDTMRAAVGEASAVLHLAGQVAVTTSIDDPIDDFEINARGTLNVLEAVRRDNRDAPVIFASTNKVYGRVLDLGGVRRAGHRCIPAGERYNDGVSEEAPLDFHSPYGCSKGAADQYVRDYARVFGLRAAVMRMSCIYGPRQFGTEDQGWIAHFFLQAVRREPITIYGDGYQVRDALHIDDAVDAWLAVLDHIDTTQGEIFNLGGGVANTLSLRELLMLMAEMGRRPADIRYDGWRAGDQPWYVSNVGKLQERTGWSPRVPLESGLRSLDAWLSSRFATPARSSALLEARP